MISGQRLSLIGLVFIGLGGVLAGYVLQQLRSGEGYGTFVPPYTLPASLIVIAGLLVFFGFRVRAQIEHKDGKTVEPFFAVRLLAAARAAQISGSLFAGFAAGLLVVLFWRPVTPANIWLPMVISIGCAVALLAAGVFAESQCRIRPEDDEPEGGLTGETNVV